MSTFDSLMYRARESHAQIMFARFLSGGSGVLVGAETEWQGWNSAGRCRVDSAASRKFGVPAQSATGAAIVEQSLDQNYLLAEGGPDLNYELSRNMSLYVNYQYERQKSSSPLCFNSNCGMLILRQVAGMGINFHAHPNKIH